MKIGRNSPCPCGSGMKYKKCCLYKTEEYKFFEAVHNSQEKIKYKSRIQECHHPKKDECQGGIIKAHAIQNKRILKKVAEEGKIKTLDGVSHLMFQSSDTKGRKTATTFTGFCSYHDKIVFQDIEDKEFIGNEKQIFLFTYRTMVWHYHKKQEQNKANEIQIQNMEKQGYKVSEENSIFAAFNIGLIDNEIEKQQMDNILLNENYDDISFWLWEIPYEISFTVSMMHELEHNISGEEINNLLNIDLDVKKIYLNIFPANGKSFCIWSWRKIHDDSYKKFTEQFSKLDIKDRENYLNNKLPLWSDSIFISPKLWDKWGKTVQESLIIHANSSLIYQTFQQEDSYYTYESNESSWDFFQDISQ